VKSYVRNTINLSCAKILLTSVISASGWLFKKKFITMHGNRDVKWATTVCKSFNFVTAVILSCQMVQCCWNSERVIS